MSGQSTRGIVTAMFTDIVDSTKLKAVMPADTATGRDEAYRATVKEPHDRRLVDAVESAGGQVVQPTGDGYLFLFHDVEQAVLCALTIHDSLSASPIETPLGPLQLRIGIHTGIGNLGDQPASAVVDKAARVQAAAEPGGLFVSLETQVLVAQLRSVHFERLPPVELKGLGPSVLYRATREDPGAKRRPGSSSADAVARLRAMENPYEFSTTANDRTFKGRRQEVEDLLASIETCTHTAIFGLQRMGKTSLIEQGLRAELKSHRSLDNSVLLASIDMQRLGGDEVTYKDFAHAIFDAVLQQLNANGLGREVPNLRNLTRDLFTASRYQRGDRTQFFATFAEFLAKLATASQRRIVLFIDEFSEIRRVIERNKAAMQRNPARTANLLPHDMFIDRPFVHHMSALLKDAALKRHLMFVVLVRPFIAEYDEREGLQLLKLMKPIMLRHLDEAAAKELITEPLEAFVAYEDGAVDDLFRLTAGHPYLLQFMLKLIVDRTKRDARPTIARADITWLKDRMIADGPAFDAQFKVLVSDYSVDEVTHPEEARLGEGLMALVSKLGQHADGWAASTEIFEGLRRHGVPKEKTESMLSQLTRTRILEEGADADDLRYRLSIPLVQERFVRQNLYRRFFRRH